MGRIQELEDQVKLQEEDIKHREAELKFFLVCSARKDLIVVVCCSLTHLVRCLSLDVAEWITQSLHYHQLLA